jgi:hypothetical protein
MLRGMLRLALLTMFACAVFASTASADASPTGFTENAALDVRASWLADKQMHVFCADTIDTWNTYIADTPSNGGNADPAGLTVPGSDTTLLHPWACADLMQRIQTPKRYSMVHFAAGLLVFTHELEHARGSIDEAQTECSALHDVARFAKAEFGFTSPLTLKRLVAEVHVQHESAPPSYRSLCP